MEDGEVFTILVNGRPYKKILMDSYGMMRSQLIIKNADRNADLKTETNAMNAKERNDQQPDNTNRATRRTA